MSNLYQREKLTSLNSKPRFTHARNEMKISTATVQKSQLECPTSSCPKHLQTTSGPYSRNSEEGEKRKWSNEQIYIQLCKHIYLGVQVSFPWRVMQKCIFARTMPAVPQQQPICTSS